MLNRQQLVSNYFCYPNLIISKYHDNQNITVKLVYERYINNHVIMCSARKYPYPFPEGIFSMTVASPLDFPKSAHKMDPPPLRKLHFCPTPPGNQKLATF